MSALVMKYGGTSVGDASAFAQVKDIVSGHAKSGDRVIAVVSAMSGVTDDLTRGIIGAAAGDEETYHKVCQSLRKRHLDLITELLGNDLACDSLISTLDSLISEYERLCASVYVLGEVTPRTMDAALSRGERLSARILVALLQQNGMRSEAIDATELIVTDATFGNAAPIAQPTRERIASHLAPLLDADVIPVVTGFIAATDDGVTTTLGRGGSDYTAAIIGDALNVDAVWIFTDVDGVMTADPRIVPNARVIPVISYTEVGELAYFGAKVLHPRTIRPVIEREIPVWVKNTFHPDQPGTRIVRDVTNTHGTVKAVTMITDLSMVTVAGRGMVGVPGIAGRTFSAVAREKTSVLMISQASSEQSICFIIPTAGTEAVVRALQEEMTRELSRRDIDRIWSDDGIVIISAIGTGMRGTPGISARIFGALGSVGINVIAIAQGSSECSISLVVDASDATRAVQQIHKEVINHGK
ncbi:MAG TPA: aspartate kinase [Candidatus Acetothermia bacterium]|nr:aspartate kinase [Candidatus Acetothermia bacterium]